MSIKLGNGVMGLWNGFAMGQVFVTLIYAYVVTSTDWQEVFELNR